MRIEDVSYYLSQPITKKKDLEIGDKIVVIHDPEDRVDSTKSSSICAGHTGTVCDLSDLWTPWGVGIRFDDDIGQHNCHGTCEDDRGYYMSPKDFRLLYEADEEISADEEAFSSFFAGL